MKRIALQLLAVFVLSTLISSPLVAQIKYDKKVPQLEFAAQEIGMWLSEDIPDKDEAFKKNEWNGIRAIVKGNNIKTWINDTPIADLTHERVAPEGVIAQQVHGYPRGKKREAGAKEILSVAWRNIKIREINQHKK